MKTYEMKITMDAVDKDDFISAVMEMNAREFKMHTKEVKE